MKNSLLTYFLPLLIGSVGLLNYIPIYFCPDFLNSLYYNYKALTFIFSLLGLVILLCCLKRKLIVLIILGLYLLCFCFSKNIRSSNNKLLINYNKNRNVENFKTPILGYILEFPSANSKVRDCDAYFKFNKTPFYNGYEALIYKKNHKLNMDSFDGDYSLRYIYDNNWWWFMGNYD